MNSLKRFLCIAFYAVLTVCVTRGEFTNATVLLKNGDRLSGSIIESTFDVIMIKTKWNPLITISREEIDQLWTSEGNGKTNFINLEFEIQIIEERFLTLLQSYKSEEISSQQYFAELKVLANEIQNYAASHLSTNTLRTLNLPGDLASKLRFLNNQSLDLQKKDKKNWYGEIQFGMDSGFGATDRKNFSGRLNLAYFTKAVAHYFTYDITYGKVEEELAANKMEGSYRSEFSLINRLYAYYDFRAGYDEVRDIDFYYETGPGLGYRLISTTNMVLNLTFGGSYQNYHYANNPSGDYLFLDFGEEIGVKLFSNLYLVENILISIPPEEANSYKIRLESGLKYFVTKNLELGLEISDFYDSNPSQGIEQNDLQIKSTIGFKF